MINHICIKTTKGGWGAWGVGLTAAAAEKIAKRELGSERAKSTVFKTADVPAGHRLEVRSLVSGVEWFVMPDDPAERGE